MRRVEDLTRDELKGVVRQIQSILYETVSLDSDGQRQEVFNQDKIWDNDAAEMIEHVDGVLVEHGLSPESVIAVVVEEGVVYWVDLPTVDCIHNDEGGWHNVGQFSSRAAALEFIREHVGNCDDDGCVSLLTKGQA